MTDDLASYLLARLAEIEQVARAADLVSHNNVSPATQQTLAAERGRRCHLQRA
jgi:hypothetical protein